MRRLSWAGCALVAVLAVAGCGDGGTVDAADANSVPTPGSSATAANPPTVTDPPVSAVAPSESAVPDESVFRAGPPPVSGEVPGGYLEAVIADAAQRAGVAQAEVQVERDQSVQWSDGSLGCPEPGMAYTQAIVDGFWVELRAGGDHYDYRLDHQGNFRLCDQPLRQPPYGNS